MLYFDLATYIAQQAGEEDLLPGQKQVYMDLLEKIQAGYKATGLCELLTSDQNKSASTFQVEIYAHLMQVWKGRVKVTVRNWLEEARLRMPTCVFDTILWENAFRATATDIAAPLQNGKRAPARYLLKTDWDEAARLATLAYCEPAH